MNPFLITFIVFSNAALYRTEFLQTSTTQLARIEWSDISKQIRPIISVEFREIHGGYICDAKSFLPVKYKVVKLFSIGNNNFEVNGRAALVRGTNGRLVIGCEVIAETKSRQYTEFIHKAIYYGDITYTFPNNILISSNLLHGRDYRRLLCVNELREYAKLFDKLAQKYCIFQSYENGFYENTQSARDRVKFYCHNETEIDQCNYNYGNAQKFSRYSHDSCQYTIKLNCIGDKYTDNSKPRIAEGKNLKSRLTIEPNRQIEENDNVIITCSTSFNLFHRKIVQLQMIDFKGQKHNLINSINDFSFNLTHIYSTFNYIATRDRINDTFICTVKDLLSQQISTPSTKILRYKMAFTKINYKVFNVLNQTGDNRLKYIEITDDTTRYYNADRLECQADSEHPMPQYSWTYITKIGEEKTVASRYLHLSDVERRIPVICRVRQEMLSDTFTGSINVTLTDFLELNRTKAIYREASLQMCGNIQQKEKISCSKNEDLLIKSVYAGHIDSCKQSINKCELPIASDFIRNERCDRQKSECRLVLKIINKVYFRVIMKQGLSSTCVSGSKPALKVNYFCIEKLHLN